MSNEVNNLPLQHLWWPFVEPYVTELVEKGTQITVDLQNKKVTNPALVQRCVEIVNLPNQILRNSGGVCCGISVFFLINSSSKISRLFWAIDAFCFGLITREFHLYYSEINTIKDWTSTLSEEKKEVTFNNLIDKCKETSLTILKYSYLIGIKFDKKQLSEMVVSTLNNLKISKLEQATASLKNKIPFLSQLFG